jgi:hypothetical protein
MSFEDCIQEHIDAGKMTAEWGAQAKEKYRRVADALQRQGMETAMARTLARDRVNEIFVREAARSKHTKLIRVQHNKVRLMEIAQAGRTPDITDKIAVVAEMRKRAIATSAWGQMYEFAERVRTNVLSQSKDPVLVEDALVRVMGFGEQVKNPDAVRMGTGAAQVVEQLRLEANAKGANIGKLDHWVPIQHNREAIIDAGYMALAAQNGGRVEAPGTLAKVRAIVNPEIRDRAIQLGFERWFNDIAPKLDWSRIENPETLMPFQAEGAVAPPMQTLRAFLREVFDNIIFGREARDVKYGQMPGQSVVSRMSRERVLHWKSADDYLAYNKVYGQGDVMSALSHHIEVMSRDIALMEQFGPDPKLGIDFDRQAWENKAFKEKSTTLQGKAQKQAKHAQRVLNVMNGPEPPQTAFEEWNATFFATKRSVISAAHLDRAVLMVPSDTASMNTAALMIGANRKNPVTMAVEVMKGMSRDDLLRMQYVYDTYRDPAVVQNRLAHDVGAKPWAQKMSNASMRVQGLAAWTDRAKGERYKHISGHFAKNAHLAFDKIDPLLRKFFELHRISELDWNDFRKADHIFTGDNGATFLMPAYFRAASSLPSARTEELVRKFGGAVEHFLELSVPTRSVYMQAFLDPAAYGMNRGSVMYELMKSTTMYKSFPLALLENLTRAVKAQPTGAMRAARLAEHVAVATVMGAIGLQARELLLGRDPQDMTDPVFWTRALLAGGGLSIAGDLLALGQTSWGGGLASYLAGPSIGVMGDALKLTVGNVFEAGADLVAGDPVDTNFIQESIKFFGRNIMVNPPQFGPVFDRLLQDQFQILLDPDSIDAIEQAEKRRENLRGNASWWNPGSAFPSRAPNPAAAFGG